jgi:hypothetical protein
MDPKVIEAYGVVVKRAVPVVPEFRCALDSIAIVSEVARSPLGWNSLAYSPLGPQEIRGSSLLGLKGRIRLRSLRPFFDS